MRKHGQHAFDRVGVIQQKGSRAVVTGQDSFSWENIYTNVRLKKLPPLRSQEKFEDRQPVSTKTISWHTKLFDRTITAEMRLVVDGIVYDIQGVREYMDLKTDIVIDTVTKDKNSAVTLGSEVTSFTLTNTTQTISTGDAITTLVGVTDQDCDISFDGTSTGLTINATDAKNFTVTGNPTSTLTPKIIARGRYGGGKVNDIAITVSSPLLWEPDDLGAALRGWWDFTESGTQTVVDGLLSQVNDRSGSNYHATQVTEVNRPVQRTKNGMMCAVFGGRHSLSISLGEDIPQPYYFFIVTSQYGTTNSNGGQWIMTNDTTSFFRSVANKGQSMFYAGAFFITTSQPELGTLGKLNHYECLANGSSSSLNIDSGTIFSATGNVGDNDLKKDFLIGNYSTNLYGFQGEIYEIILVEGLLSSENLTNMRTYVDTKYGL